MSQRSRLAVVVPCVLFFASAMAIAAGEKDLLLGRWECKDKAGHDRITYKEAGRCVSQDLNKTKKEPIEHWTYVPDKKLLFHIGLTVRDHFILEWKGKDEFVARHIKTGESRVWKRVKAGD